MFFFFLNVSMLYPGTNSELSNTSETEELGDRDQRPRGLGADERGSRRGGRGRGTNTGRGRGGPGAKPSNSISSGSYGQSLGLNISSLGPTRLNIWILQ